MRRMNYFALTGLLAVAAFYDDAARAKGLEYVVFRVDTRTTQTVTSENPFSITETLRPSEWLAFTQGKEQFSLQLMHLLKKDAVTPAESAAIYAKTAGGSLFKTMPEYSDAQFGKYIIRVLNVDPRERQATIVVSRRYIPSKPKPPAPGTRKTPKPKTTNPPATEPGAAAAEAPRPAAAVSQHLSAGEGFTFMGLRIVLVRVSANRLSDDNDDEARFVLTTARGSTELGLREYHSQIQGGVHGDYLIYAPRIRPSFSRRNDGRVTVQVTYRPH